MVLPVTAHAAFHKAAHYFGVEAVMVDVGADFRAVPEAMADAIDDRTVLVVASAPSYAHGVVDPVERIAAAAAARGVRCHVDACIGGWVLPYAARLGRDDDSTRAELESAYKAEVAESTLGTEFAAGELFGILDGTGPEAKITHLWGGTSCNMR